MGSQPQRPQLKLWGGIECSRVRVHDNYFDQLERSDHVRRIDDLDRIAELGIRTLRYPVLWEQAAPRAADRIDWSWADDRLRRLRELEIQPIVGLVHHGSGPRYTNLLDENFATGLAKYAGALAERHPWVRDYTPVNEPLTTARFSALYGHWYPHARDGLTFARAQLNECRAVVLAMEAVRKIRSDAQLVQTEDLGKTFSTPRLSYQAEFENERRWLTFDLLTGRVDQHHPLGQYMLWLGIPREELAWFQDHPCPPDVVGVNHYLTSERFLDDRVECYSPHCHGGNGRDVYVDTEAIRVLAEGTQGTAVLLQETWERYRLPLAVTEAHLGCTREEQLRWLWQMWKAAETARGAGADVRAVTVWSLLGAYDWDSLMTLPRGHYESGAFDVRSDRRPTAVAALARELATGTTPTSPVLEQPGWWQRPERLFPAFARPVPACPLESPGRPLLIAGARGTLGRAFARICQMRGLPYYLASRDDMDIADPESVASTIQRNVPWGVINAAGFVRIDAAEEEAEQCIRENVHGAEILAHRCAAANIPLVTFSSDLVFDGHQRFPYRESDAVNPLCVYGKTKVDAERKVMSAHPKALIVRTSAFFGPWDQLNFVSRVLEALRAGQDFFAVEDAIVSPTYLPDLVHTCLDLLLDGAVGIWHVANRSEVTGVELARMAARIARFDESRIHPCPLSHFGWSATRPPYSVLGSERGLVLPPIENALARYFAEPEVASLVMAT